MNEWFYKYIFCSHNSVVSPNGYPEACEDCMYYLGEEAWFWKKIILEIKFSLGLIF